jgi:hypothetical protein
MRKRKMNPEKITQFWVVSIILIYGLLMSEYFNILRLKIIETQMHQFISNPIFNYLESFSFILMLFTAFVVWLISSFIFHLFAILMGGESTFKNFQKYTGLCYIIPIIGFIIAIVIFDRIEFPKENLNEFLVANKSMVLINWIINICSTLCFILPIPIIKYLYQLNWLKAIGSVVIPIGSIYLLSQFFANFVL